MAYSELIKDFNRIRAYLREFYVYGFRTREEFGAKSARSYDNERRRVESWLGEYMRFRLDESGKQVFLSLDSRALARNPMYKAFKAKSFTDMDIVFHFCLLDMLSRGNEMTSREVTDKIVYQYLPAAESELMPDESTIRKKLKEYEGLGLLMSRKRGREICYRPAECTIDLDAWQDALQFFTEDTPCGVIGSPLLQDKPSAFGFKHRYLFGALDGEILLMLLECMNTRHAVEITIFSRKKKQELRHTIFPVKLYFSTQTGRQYVYGYHYRQRRPIFLRLDSIRLVKTLEEETRAKRYQDICALYAGKLWGVASVGNYPVEHFEMDIHADTGEAFIPDRLRREGRQGTVMQMDEQTWRFSVDVYDALELLPWIRTFIGRIIRVDCSNPRVLQTLREDLLAMTEMYGGAV